MPLIKLKSSSLVNSIDLKGVPTASAVSNIATTQMVRQEISNLVDSAPELLNTLAEIAASISTDENKAN
jgi:hypothetical protein